MQTNTRRVPPSPQSFPPEGVLGAEKLCTSAAAGASAEASASACAHAYAHANAARVWAAAY
eukprot:2704098-Rhodomonas_salina.1